MSDSEDEYEDKRYKAQQERECRLRNLSRVDPDDDPQFWKEADKWNQ